MSATGTPERLGKYEIRRVLGRGAMGVVYDGWDPVIDRRVAIKTVRLPQGDDPEAADSLDRFKREAQAAGRLIHPNIVGVFDYGETAEVAFIVMEFVEGRSLKEMLDADLRLPVAEAVRIVGSVLAGLVYSHGRGVVHRDIKPANIMVAHLDGQAKIADFGIARIEASSMTQVGTVMGTPAYMSPEQFKGEVVDPRTDIYSCGVMLYQLLAGERPYEGSMTSIMHKVMTSEPPRPSSLAVTAPRNLDAVVARAMARRPEDRYADAAAFAEALRNPPVPIDPEPDIDATVLTLPARGAAPATATPVAARRRSRLPVLLGGLVLAGIAAAVALLLRPAPEPPASEFSASEPSTSPTRTAAVTPAPALVPPSTTAPVPSLPTQTGLPTTDPQPTPAVTPTAPAAAAPEPSPTQPTAPTLATPQPAPAPPALAAPPAPAEAAMAPPLNPASIPCSLIQSTPRGRVALAGPDSGAAVEQAAPGTPLRLVDPTFCPVLNTLRSIADRRADALQLDQAGGPVPLHDNEVIALQVTMPAFGGYLQVAYVQHDRTVAPLMPGAGYPAQTYPARRTVTLGQPRSEFTGWIVGPPFGADMIVAVASTAPLWAPPLKDSQPLDAYLASLQATVDALRRRGGTVAVAALPLDTRAAQ